MKLNKIIYITSLLLVLFILSQCDLRKRELSEFPPFYQNANADYCAGAPECYTLDENGNEMLKFKLNVPDSKWVIPQMELVGNYNEYQKYWTQRAWDISGYDKEFMVMLKAENGLFNHDRKSQVPNEDSWGFCQIHRYFHPQIVNDPRFLTDPEWQLEQCFRLWKGGTKFYGYINSAPREQARKHFIFKN